MSVDRSRWMTDLPEAKRLVQLNTLAIPGSHDSFAYQLNDRGPWAADAGRSERYIGTVFGAMGKRVIRNWSITQQVQATEQLKLGVRYFDFRVSTMGRSRNLYIVHKFFGPTILPILREFKAFLDANPGEVVILDFQHLYGMSLKRHQQLSNFISATFDTKLVPRSTGMQNLSLDKLSRAGQQVIVIYRQNFSSIQATVTFFHRNPNLWTWLSINSPWGNKQTASTLLQFLDVGYARTQDADQFYVYQAILTPTAGIILSGTRGSLIANMARAVAPRLLEWLTTRRPVDRPGGSGINIFMVDAVDVGELVAETIRLNRVTGSVGDVENWPFVDPRDSVLKPDGLFTTLCCLGSGYDQEDEADDAYDSSWQKRYLVSK